MLMETSAAPDEVATPMTLQLRVLAGAHEGACAAVARGEAVLLGTEPDADVWLLDVTLPMGTGAWLYTDGVRWALSSEPVAVDVDWPAALQSDAAHPVGEGVWLGEACITISVASVPWQAVPPRPQRSAPSDEGPQPSGEVALSTSSDRAALAVVPPVDEAGLDPEQVVVQQAQDLSSQEQMANAERKPVVRSTRVMRWLGGALLLVALLCAVAWAVWQSLQSAPPVITEPAPVSAAEQQRAVQDARLAIATVDPMLRLQITPLPEGGVRVAGWLPDQRRLDAVMQALGQLRPLPRVALGAVSELRDLVAEVGAEHGTRLSLQPMPDGSVQLHGVAWPEVDRARLLADVQQRLPAGLLWKDALHTPGQQAVAVAAWLKDQGFVVPSAVAEAKALRLHVQLRGNQRRALEQLLLQKPPLLEGVPFTLTVQEPAAGAAPAGLRRLAANAPGVPVKVRTVVGGALPYVVTARGDKLQLGAQVGPWRLAAVAADHVRWEGPYTLEVAR